MPVKTGSIDIIDCSERVLVASVVDEADSTTAICSFIHQNLGLLDSSVFTEHLIQISFGEIQRQVANVHVLVVHWYRMLGIVTSLILGTGPASLAFEHGGTNPLILCFGVSIRQLVFGFFFGALSGLVFRTLFGGFLFRGGVNNLF